MTRLIGLKFLLFAAVCAVCGAWLVSVTGNIRFFADTKPYAALLDDVTGLVQSDSVLLGGVRVGEVTGIDVERGKARVAFTVDEDIVVRESWEIGARWRNVLGQRYLYLYPAGGGAPLEPGETLPLAQARAPADIGRLLDELAPVLRALDPEQQNRLLAALNTALDGREEQVRELVADLGALSSTLAEREQRIRSVIAQGSALLGAYARREEELRALLDDVAALSSTLATRNDEIVGAIEDIGAAQDELSRLLEANDAELHALVDDLEAVTANIRANRDDFARAVATAPEGLATYMLISRWGQWFNIRGVATQVQMGGEVVHCQTEAGEDCAIPNREVAGGSRVPARGDALAAVVSAALPGREAPEGGVRR